MSDGVRSPDLLFTCHILSGATSVADAGRVRLLAACWMVKATRLPGTCLEATGETVEMRAAYLCFAFA